MRGLLYGVGNDDHVGLIRKRTTLAGKRVTTWRCPYFTRWYSLLQRCYWHGASAKFPSYIGCSVCEEWLTFSNFKSWMEQQDWEGKQLDKDLLIGDNKVYSPETCVFVSQEVNTFLVTNENTHRQFPIGAHPDKRRGKFYSSISKGNIGVHLGTFTTPHEAHRAWQKAKFTQAFELAEQQTDLKVVQGLLRVANKIKDDYDNNLETKDF